MTHRKLRLFAVLGALVAWLAFGGPAGAQNCKANKGEKVDPSVSQYVEEVPSSCGPRRGSKGNKTVGKLPSKTRQTLSSQASVGEAQLLEQVVTSTQYGAPEKRIKLRKKQRKELRTLRNDPPRPIPSAIGTVVDAEDRGLLALAIALGVMTAAAVGAAVLRARAARGNGR
jgi:hypothetical protein